MAISIVIDNNAWNFLFDRSIDLARELPPKNFKIFMPREVEIEVNAIPDEKDGVDKRPLKEFIRDTIAARSIVTSAIFGFAEANPSSGPPIHGGFGTFQSDEERAWYAREETRAFIENRPTRKSGLTKNLADAALAAASFHAVVLTCDKKRGPISDAKNNGGMVVYLSEVDFASHNLSQVVSACASAA